MYVFVTAKVGLYHKSHKSGFTTKDTKEHPQKFFSGSILDTKPNKNSGVKAKRSQLHAYDFIQVFLL